MYVHLLDLIIRHGQTKLPNSRLDGVPARQARGEVDVTGQAKVGRVENLVCAGVVEDGLGVDAGLVSESAEAGDGVVKGRVDLDSLGHHILDLNGVRILGSVNVDAGLQRTSLSMWSLYLPLT
jgi:hypothetical protein